MGGVSSDNPPEQGAIALAPQAQFVLAPSDCTAAVWYFFWVLTKAESATGFRGHVFLEVVDQKLGQKSGQAETSFIRGHTGGCLEPRWVSLPCDSLEAWKEGAVSRSTERAI